MIRFSREKIQYTINHTSQLVVVQSNSGVTDPHGVSRWRSMVSSRGRPLLPLLPLLSPWDMPRCLRFLHSLLHRIVSSVCSWLLCIPRHWRRCLTSLCLASRCLWSRGRVSLRQTLHRRGPWRMCPEAVDLTCATSVRRNKKAQTYGNACKLQHLGAVNFVSAVDVQEL